MQLIPHRYPFLMVDRVIDLIPERQRASASRMSRIGEPHFQGHFPQRPIMPGVLIIEAMAQTAAVLVVETLGPTAEGKLVYFMTVENARFRRPVVPGDTLHVHVFKERSRGNVWKFRGEAKVAGALVAEATYRRHDHGYVIADRRSTRPPWSPARPRSRRRRRSAPIASSAPMSILGDRVRLLSHVVVDGRDQRSATDHRLSLRLARAPAAGSEISRANPAALMIGARNQIREHVTMNPGTEGGGMVTRVGDDGLFMVGAHVAHDCMIGDHVIMANNATLGGHVDHRRLCHYRRHFGGPSVRAHRPHAMVGGMTGVETGRHSLWHGDRRPRPSARVSIWSACKRRGFSRETSRPAQRLSHAVRARGHPGRTSRRGGQSIQGLRAGDGDRRFHSRQFVAGRSASPQLENAA